MIQHNYDGSMEHYNNLCTQDVIKQLKELLEDEKVKLVEVMPQSEMESRLQELRPEMTGKLK